MLTIAHLQHAHEPIAKLDVEVLLRRLGYRPSIKNGVCDQWSINPGNFPLVVPLDQQYTLGEQGYFFTPEHAQELATVLARHQRILEKGRSGPALG